MRLFTTAHLLLFLYVVSAIVFWGFSLQKHSKTIYDLEYQALQSEIDSVASAEVYNKRLAVIEEKKNSRTKQYWGEGSTFLLVILIGAAVVYSSFRRSIKLSRQQNNFMLSVTHELKSPIAAMKLNLQTMERHNLDDSKRELLVDRCIAESNRLNDLCNNMLLASQMEGRQYKPSKEELNYTNLIEDSIKEYNTRYPGRLVTDTIEEVAIIGDRVLVQMAVNNLLENAIKYTPADELITVSLFRKNNYALFQVADKGPGIPDEEKNKVVRKFYRIGNEETRKSKGTGLGLYITSRIIRQHDGKLHIKDNEPHGAIFEMCLPLPS